MLSARLGSLLRFIGVGVASGALLWSVTEGSIRQDAAMINARRAELPEPIERFYSEYDRNIESLKKRGIELSLPEFNPTIPRENPMVEIRIRDGKRHWINYTQVGKAGISVTHNAPKYDTLERTLKERSELIPKDLQTSLTLLSQNYSKAKPAMEGYYGKINAAGYKAFWRGAYSGAKKGAGWSALAGVAAFGGAAAARKFQNRKKRTNFNRRTMRR